MTRDQAKRAALKTAIAHFANRADVTPAIFEGFVHRETERFMGVPVTPFRQNVVRRTRRRLPEPTVALKPAGEAITDLERLLAASIEEKT